MNRNRRSQTAGDDLRDHLQVYDLPFVQNAATIAVPLPDGGSLVISSSHTTTEYARDEHTGWEVTHHAENGGRVANIRGYAHPFARTYCVPDSASTAAAVMFYISQRSPLASGPLWPDDIDDACGFARCAKDCEEGRPVHIVPATFPDGSTLSLPTYHYATTEEAQAAADHARFTAATITTDEELYAARRLGEPYRLLRGWIAPTAR